MKTPIITSTNIISIISPYYFLLDLSFSVAALTALEPACPIICSFANITIPEALFLGTVPYLAHLTLYFSHQLAESSQQWRL